MNFYYFPHIYIGKLDINSADVSTKFSSNYEKIDGTYEDLASTKNSYNYTDKPINDNPKIKAMKLKKNQSSKMKKKPSVSFQEPKDYNENQKIP
ncbi:hypothetical protein HZS_5879 [Henneguya salminicola]|nr:hypothetical protein HZS_5879 [Henneguya salminicola]